MPNTTNLLPVIPDSVLLAIVIWAFLLGLVVYHWIANRQSTKGERTFLSDPLEMLPVCACGNPQVAGAHGPDSCDLAPR